MGQAKTHKKISLRMLMNVMLDGADAGKRYCFILGAGASATSGIKSGTQMSGEWLKWINEKLDEDEKRQWMDELKIPADALNAESKHYFDIFDLRFFGDYSAGYTYLRKAMERAQPSFGYYHLASMLANTRNNLVITTNFDTLIEEALSFCADKKPLVIDHEQLAQYTDINVSRPVILQINRGLFFDPLNRREDLQGLPEQWEKVLNIVFGMYTPVVVGYAGGDRSLMSFLRDSAVPLRGLYWCCRDLGSLPDEVRELVRDKDGRCVVIEGFDEMMFQLGQAFGHKSPVERIRSVADSRVKLYQDKNDEMVKKYSAIHSPTESQKQVLSSLENADEQAVRDLTAAIEKNPASANLYFERAVAHTRLKQHGAAIDDYTKAIGLNPKFVAAYNNRGIRYDKLKQYDAAMADYNKAIELDAEYALAYDNRGVVYSHLKQYDAAMADHCKAIELYPENAGAYNNRGYVYMRRKKYDKAMDDISKAIRLDPEYVASYVTRGRIYFHTGQYDAALADLNKAAALDPSIPNTYYWLGKTTAALHQSEKAGAYFAKAKELGYEEGDPDDPR